MTENEMKKLAIGIAQMEAISEEIKKLNKHIEENNLYIQQLEEESKYLKEENNRLRQSNKSLRTNNEGLLKGEKKLQGHIKRYKARCLSSVETDKLVSLLNNLLENKGYDVDLVGIGYDGDLNIGTVDGEINSLEGCLDFVMSEMGMKYSEKTSEEMALPYVVKENGSVEVSNMKEFWNMYGDIFGGGAKSSKK